LINCRRGTSVRSSGIVYGIEQKNIIGGSRRGQNVISGQRRFWELTSSAWGNPKPGGIHTYIGAASRRGLSLWQTVTQATDNDGGAISTSAPDKSDPGARPQSRRNVIFVESSYGLNITAPTR